MIEHILMLSMPVIGIAMAIGFVYWQSWRDGVLPGQRSKKK
ncbi:hypothetical protein SAMN05880590_101400 [Rhizobium sp. RU35A]|nr:MULTISPECIES: hypothetical protein [Rhizobium]SIP95193.1 hypothetical protein SAMN05880590_101400 [Rhizobium sp. RU35A]